MQKKLRRKRERRAHSRRKTAARLPRNADISASFLPTGRAETDDQRFFLPALRSLHFRNLHIIAYTGEYTTARGKNGGHSSFLSPRAKKARMIRAFSMIDPLEKFPAEPPGQFLPAVQPRRDSLPRFRPRPFQQR